MAAPSCGWSAWQRSPRACWSCGARELVVRWSRAGSLPARRLPGDPRALEELLRDGQVRRAPALLPRGPRPIPIGFAALDAALGGGLARGQRHEIVGAPG